MLAGGGHGDLRRMGQLAEVRQRFEVLRQRRVDQPHLLAQVARDEGLEALHPLPRLGFQVLLAERAGRVVSPIREGALAGFDEAPRRLPHLPPGLAAGARLRLVGKGVGSDLVDGGGGAGQAGAQLGNLLQRPVVEAAPGLLERRREPLDRGRPLPRRGLQLLAAVGGDRRLRLLQVP